MVDQVIMVCISDGRANVPMAVSNGEPVSISMPLYCIAFKSSRQEYTVHVGGF